MLNKIDAKSQDSDEKTKNLTEYLTAIIESMMDQIKFSKLFSYKKDSSKAQYPTTVVPVNKKALLLEGGNSTKIGGI